MSYKNCTSSFFCKAICYSFIMQFDKIDGKHEFYNYTNFQHIRSDVLLSGRPKTAEFVAWVVDKEAANSRRECITEMLCV